MHRKRSIQYLRGTLYQGGIGDQLVYESKSNLLRMAGVDHHVNEETVTRAAVFVRLSAHRTRWIDGSTHTWYGWKVGPGEGEGSSGLRYDYIDRDE